MTWMTVVMILVLMAAFACMVIGLSMLAARARRVPFMAAARACNEHGYVVLRPEEVPNFCTQKLGYVTVPADKWNVLVQAVCTRTNVSGQVEGMLRSAGIVE